MKGMTNGGSDFSPISFQNIFEICKSFHFDTGNFIQKVRPLAILYRKCIHPFCHNNMDSLSHTEIKELQISGGHISGEHLLGK